MAQKEYAVIVAAGKGTRFGGGLPKQFTNLAGKPVLFHTVEAFLRYSPAIHLVLVLSDSDVAHWKDMSKDLGFNHKITLQAGGATRFASVKNGLDVIGDEGWVAIHDGARPLVTPQLIKASFDMAMVHNAGIAAVRPKDSIRIAMNEFVSETTSHELTRQRQVVGDTRSIDREQVRLIQTPQTFRTDLIKEAYRQAAKNGFQATDDASVAEAAGYPVHLFEGSYENIKITTPEDLLIAEAILHYRKTAGS